MNVAHSIQIGMRGEAFTAREYYDFGKDQGMKVIHAYEMHDMGADKVIGHLRTGWRQALFYHF